MSDEELEARLLAALQKLEERDPGGTMVIFTAAEAEALSEIAKWWTTSDGDVRDVVIWWSRLKGATAIGSVLGSVAKWFLVFIAFMAALKAGFLDFLELGGKP